MVETLWHLILCALKAFAARVFAFLYTIDMKVMNLGLLFFFFFQKSGHVLTPQRLSLKVQCLLLHGLKGDLY